VGIGRKNYSNYFFLDLFTGDLIINEEDKLSLAPKEFNFDKNQILESLKKISEIKLDYLLPGYGEAVKEKVNEKIRDFVLT